PVPGRLPGVQAALRDRRHPAGDVRAERRPLAGTRRLGVEPVGGTGGFGALAAVRGASRASRGGPGRLWPPRDARDVRGFREEVTGRDGVHASGTGPCGRAAPEPRSSTKTPGTSHFPALRGPRSRPRDALSTLTLL